MGTLANRHLLHVFPSFEAGGAQLRIANVINRIGPVARHSVMALNGNFQAAYRLRPECNVRLLPPPPGMGGFWSVLALRSALRQERPDLLLTYNWGTVDAVLAARLAGLAPVIHNECGLSDEASGLKLRRVLYRRVVLRGAWRTIATSRTMEALARNEFGVPAGRVQFIQTGVDAERFHPGENPELRRRLNLPEGGLVCGYLGGLRQEKNPALLLRAFAAACVPGSALVLFGTGPLNAELEQLAASLGVAGQVVFAGHTEDSAAALRSLDVFLMSSLTEQTSNALLEAMATGLPVVMTDVGDTADLLGEMQRPFVVPSEDLMAYTVALTRLLSDAALREALGRGNRQRCEERYSQESMLREYVALYEQSLAQEG